MHGRKLVKDTETMVMAFIGVKTFKAIGSLFLFILATLAVWKEIKLSQKMCEESSANYLLLANGNRANAAGDTLLPRRPVRNSPVRKIHRSLNKSYINNDHLERNYERIEHANVTLFVSSPPSSGIVNLLELFYALPIIRDSVVVPLVDNKILSTGNYSAIEQYVHKAIEDAQPPALVHTHAYHVNVSASLRNKSLLMISVVRDPIQRAVSMYNYARVNNTRRDSEQIRKWRETLNINKRETYDDCVKLKRSECVSEGATTRLIRHFCGYDRRCRKKTRWTLERAKHNIETNYFVIGTREDMEIFVQVLERRLPSIFKEGSRVYNNLLDIGKVTRGDRYTKVMPSDDTIEKMKSMMALDIELYEWIIARFEDAQRNVGLKI